MMIYEDIELSEIGLNELGERSDTWLIGDVELVEDEKIGKARRGLELFEGFESSLLVSSSQHHRHAL